MHWISLLVCGLLQARLGSAVVVFAGFSNAATQRYISDAVNTMFAEAQNAINTYDAGMASVSFAISRNIYRLPQRHPETHVQYQ